MPPHMKKLVAVTVACVALFSIAGCPSSGGDGYGDDDDDDGATPGCRAIQVSSGVDGNTADDSAYYTSVIGGTDFSEFLGAGGFADTTVTLCMGVIGSGGKAALTLQEDAVEAISLPDDTCLCRQLLATGSTGTLYCAASAEPLDFTLSRDSMGAGAAGPETLVVSGAVPGEGHIRMSFSAKATTLDVPASGCTVAACGAAFGGLTAFDTLYTTGTATAEFLNPAGGGATRTASLTGKPFDDDPNDGTADCEDWESGAGLGALAGAPGHDEDNPSAGDVVTVERIAESAE